MNDETKKVNIRATPEERFWGNKFDESFYLWPSALHNLTLAEMAELTTPVLPSLFAEKELYEKAHDDCRQIFHSFLPKFATQLNKLHGLELPDIFWKTATGVWLYRHICIAYDRFYTMEQLEIDSTDIKLLDRESFHVPNDHPDYVYFFCSDIGAMQMITQYYNTFGTKHFSKCKANWSRPYDLHPDWNLIIEKPKVEERSTPRNRLNIILHWKNRTCARLRSFISKFLRLVHMRPPNKKDKNTEIQRTKQKNDMGLLLAWLPSDIQEQLFEKSKGAVDLFSLPKVICTEKPMCHEWRSSLTEVPVNTRFEKYFWNSMEHAIPKIFVEYFKDYYDVYSEDVSNRHLTNILTETWITCIPVSFYFAVARHINKTKLLVKQHGLANQWHARDTRWLIYETVDYYITTGWRNEAENTLPGGFASYIAFPPTDNTTNNLILHISTTKYNYLDWLGNGMVNFHEFLLKTKTLLQLIPNRLKENYIFRPRRAPTGFCNTEEVLDVEKLDVSVDQNSDVATSLKDVRLVIVDHLGGSLVHVLAYRTPFLLLRYDDCEPLADKYAHVFDDLIESGVAHTTPESAMKKLDEIYDDVEGWWVSPPVQKAVNDIADEFVKPASCMVDCLLSLVNCENFESN